MKHILRLALILGSLFIFCKPLQAAHIVGADITYRCLNQTTGLHEVRIVLYRDCQGGGAGFDDPITVFVFRGSTGQLQTTFNIAEPGASATQIIPPNWAACTASPYTLCVEYKEYIGTVVLSPRVGGYDIGWARCCRNNSVSNIALNQGVTVTAHVPGTDEATGCNSTPTFNNLAPQFLCANQTFNFDHSATDTNGDSLVYRICNPYSGLNGSGLGATTGFGRATVRVGGPGGGNPMGPPPYNNITYVTPFSYLNPFGNNMFSIDRFSGLLTITPAFSGQYVFAICVDEYRNGVLLSTNQRDFQINIINCTNQGLPPVPTNTFGALDTVRVNPLDTVCYDVSIAGGLSTDTVQLFPVSAIFGIGGSLPAPLATLTTIGPNPGVDSVLANVCWVPGCNYAGDTIPMIVGGNNLSNCFGLNLVFDTVVVIVGGANEPVITHTLPGGGTGPSFTVNPNQNFCYTFDVTDADTLDSLRAFWVNGPFTGGNAATFSSTTGSPISGNVCWTPTCADAGQTFQFVVAGRDTNAICPQQRTSYDTVTLTVRPLPNVNVQPAVSTICFGDSVQLRATGGPVTRLWQPSAGLSDTTSSIVMARPDTTTTYTVANTDNFGCVQTLMTTVNVNPLPVVTITPDTFVCPRDTLQLLATGGTQYAWSPALGLSATNVANPRAFPTDTTTYTVVVTDANNCVSEDSVRIETMNITVAPMAPVTICDFDTVQLSSSGGVTYAWSNGISLSNSMSPNPLAFPHDSTTFVVTITDVNSCVDFDSVQIFVNPLPTITITPDTAICIGDAFTLKATGGTTYSWAPAAGLNDSTLQNPQANPTVTTTYVVTVTDANSCVDTDTVTVTVNALPNVFAGNDTTNCEYQGVQLTATGASVYSWSPATGLSATNIANPIANPLVSTTYTVVGVDTNGCVNADQVMVDVFNGNVSADQTICIFDSVQLVAGTGVAYSWNNGASLTDTAAANPFAFPTTTTTYIVQIFHASGCADPDTVTVNVNPLPIVTALPDTAICIGDGFTLRATGGVNYSWSPTTGLVNPNTASPTATPTVTTDYVVTVTDTNTCVNTDTATVVVNPLPNVFAGNDTTNCEHQGVQLTATGAATYSWSPATGLSATNIANPIANPLVSTTYTVVGVDTNACVNADQVLVDVFNGSVIGDQTICIFDTVQLAAFGGVSYSWNNGASLSSATAASPRAFPTTTTQYIVNIFHASGCSDPDTVNVFVNPLPVITTHADTAICIGDTIGLFATGGTSYQWSNLPSIINGNTSNPTVFPTDTTRYYVTVTDGNTCMDTDSVDVIVHLLPIVNAGNDTAKCGDIGVPLNATGGVTYSWTPTLGLSNPNISDPVANPDSSTMYYVTITDTNACVNRDSIHVRTMYADAGPDMAICIYDSIQLQAAGGVAYLWANATVLTNANIANPIAFPIDTTDFVVTVVDTTGCLDTDTMRLTVNPLPVTSVSNPDPYVCDNGATQLTATGGNTYIWQADTTLSALNIFNPIATPRNLTPNLVDSTWYYVTVIDSNMCVNYDSIGLEVRLRPIVSVSNDTFACPNTVVPISAAGGISYSWSPTVGLSDPLIANPNAFPDTTTLYTATITAVWGCFDTASVLVYTIAPEAGADQEICFNDSTQLQAGGGVSYSWAPTIGLSNPSIANPMASPPTTTTYVVTVTDSVGCVDTDTMVLTVHALPPADAGPDAPLCIFDSLMLNASGGISYQWDPNPSLSALNIPNPTANPLGTTTYYVTVTDTNTCHERDSVTITVNLLPPADAGPDITKCGEPGVQLQASGGVIYQWFPTDSLSNPNIANPIANPTDTTTYYVLVTDTNTCQNIDSVTVSTMYATSGPGGTICFGDTIQLTSGGGIGYAWTPGQPLSDSTIANPLARPDTTTTFIVTVLDPSGCTDTANVVVNVLPAPPADAGPDTSVCFGLSTMLQAGGGVSYVWDADTTLSSLIISNPIASPIDTTTYYVTVTGANGCMWRDSVTVDVHPLPIADAGADQAICIGDTTQLNGAGASFFLWDNAATLNFDTLADPLAFPIVSTTYGLLVTDTNGCVDTDTMELTVNLLPIPDAGQDTGICIGLSTMLQASGGSQYVWDIDTSLSNLNIANPIAMPLDTTTYYVTVIDTNSCFARDSVTVDVYPLPPADAGPDAPICFEDSIQLMASGGVIYNWLPDPTLSDPNIFNPFAKPSVTTTYYLAVTDTLGCIEVDSVEITVNPLPIANAGRDQEICIGDSIQLNGRGAATFLWDNAATLTDDTIANPIAFPIVTTDYGLLVTDGNGCQDRDTVKITVNPLPLADAGRDTAICLLEQIRLVASGGVRYTWDADPALSSTTVKSPFANPQDTTTFWVTVQDDKGCIARDSVVVVVWPLPTAYAGEDTAICIGDTLQLMASGGIRYQWSPSGAVLGADTPDPITWTRFSRPFFVTVTDANLCQDKDTIFVTVNPLPRVEASEDTTICEGFAASLRATGASGYIWTPAATLDDPFSATPFASPVVDQLYTVVGTDSNLCVNSDKVKVNVIPKPDVSGPTLDSICKFQLIDLIVEGGVSRLWSTGQETELITVNPTTTTTYWALVFDKDGCPSDTFYTTVLVAEDLPRARFEPTPLEGFYPLEVNFNNLSPGTTRSFWRFGDGFTDSTMSPTHTYNTPGQYDVTLVVDNEIGCPDSLTYSFIDVWEDEIFFPNAFSPNDDGTNDFFYLPNGGYERLDIQIFDRWGRIVFASTDPNFRWDGRKNGVSVPEGVYVFHVKGTTFLGKTVERSGSITVIR